MKALHCSLSPLKACRRLGRAVKWRLQIAAGEIGGKRRAAPRNNVLARPHGAAQRRAIKHGAAHVKAAGATWRSVRWRAGNEIMSRLQKLPTAGEEAGDVIGAFAVKNNPSGR